VWHDQYFHIYFEGVVYKGLFGFVLPPVIAKVFRQADTEEMGQVDPSIVPGLAMKVLGGGIKDTEKQMIQYKSQMKACMWCVCVCFHLGG